MSVKRVLKDLNAMIPGQIYRAVSTARIDNVYWTAKYSHALQAAGEVHLFVKSENYNREFHLRGESPAPLTAPGALTAGAQEEGRFVVSSISENMRLLR